MTRAATILLTLGFAASALAQEAPPVDESQPLPAGHPPVEASGPMQQQVPNVLRPPASPMAFPNASLPAGSVRVIVVDPEDRPVANSAVDLGVMGSGGERSRQNSRTNGEGVAMFEGLPVGTGQAYRVNVAYRGATYSSIPFQLDSERGVEARIVRLPVTNEDRFVFFTRYRVIMEIVEERLKITQYGELTNAGQETYVFPRAGVRARLPEGALAFHTEALMTDQRLEEVQGGEMIALRGSLPPGTVQLAWSYDVPLEDPMRLAIPVPLRVFELEVFSQAAEQLEMDVLGLPDAQRIDNEGMSYWGTGMRRGPSDPRIDHVTVVLTNVPGPGPLRWLAMGLAVLMLALGIYFLVARVDGREAGVRALQARRDALLAEARELEKDLAEGEIGPEFRQNRRAEIVRELAVLLHEEEAAKRSGTPAPGTAHQAR